MLTGPAEGANIEIERVQHMDRAITQLSDLLRRVVEAGASVGFLPGLSDEEANAYWNSVLSPDVHLLIASRADTIVGTVQIQFCTKANGIHRVEIAKLMTHPDFRRLGIARALMCKAETMARQYDKRLIVLDTRAGDSSNILYRSLGYEQVGVIPQYAMSANGLDATVIYYKLLAET